MALGREEDEVFFEGEQMCIYKIVENKKLKAWGSREGMSNKVFYLSEVQTWNTNKFVFWGLNKIRFFILLTVICLFFCSLFLFISVLSKAFRMDMNLKLPAVCLLSRSFVFPFLLLKLFFNRDILVQGRRQTRQNIMKSFINICKLKNVLSYKIVDNILEARRRVTQHWQLKSQRRLKGHWHFRRLICRNEVRYHSMWFQSYTYV